MLKPFNEATEISYEKVTPKKTRTIDVKEFVKEPIVASVKDGMVTLTMGMASIRKVLLNLVRYGTLVKTNITGRLQVAMKFIVKRLWWKMKKVVTLHWKLITNSFYINFKQLYKL